MSSTPSSRSIVAAFLGAALILVATPAVAQAQTPAVAPAALTPSDIATIMAANDGKVGLRNHKSQKYLEPRNAGTAQGTRVVQQSLRPLVRGDLDPLQNWTVSEVDVWYVFKNVKTTKALGLNNGSTAAGTPAVTATGDGSLNQDWQFRSVPQYPAGVYHLVNAKDPTKCLGISGASMSNDAQAAIFPCDTSNNQGWEVVDPR